ncbi:DUF3558 domain-containing protein [Streptomyces sp. NPDC057682]|uniref:DUF3558 domain-containing protein n=1 Tax=Streptomyces sp. NPDC057682 TaxID=3346210 RepID=UPI0036D05DEF
MHRSAPRLARILACAAVPVMLVVAGCSSDSDGGKKDDASSAAPKPSKTEPAVAPARFAELPEPCDSVSAKTVTSLVPSVKTKSGTRSKSSDAAARGGCSWNGLDDNGVKGSQYRWLDVGFTRSASDQALGSGADRAAEDYKKQVAKAQAAEGAKKLATVPVTGIGEQATAITYDLSKTGEDFKYATVIARTGNVVVTVNYNGAGYAGAKTPSGADILKGAEKAAKEAVASVADANEGATTAPSGSPKPSASAKTG